MAQNTPLQNERYHSVDFLKGICILFVIVTHYAWTDTERLRLLFPFWIDMAVPIFMILSGFVFTKSYLKHNIKTYEQAYAYENWLGKLIRFSFPFLIAFAVEEVACRFLGIVRHNALETATAFVQGGFGPGSYYYPILVQFIFYFPVLFFLVQKYRLKGLVLCGGINLLFEFFKTIYGMNAEFYRLLIFRYTLVIAFGCYLALGDYPKTKKRFIPASILGIGYILATKYFGLKPIFTDLWTGTSMWASLYILPIIAWLIANRKIQFKPIELLGKASYNIFLVQMVYYNAAPWIYRHIGSVSLRILVNTVVCVSVGLLFFYAETPITKAISRKANAAAERLLNRRKSA